MKTTPGQPEQLPEREEAELDHEWLQLIQMEKMIKKHKNDLLKTGAKDHWDMDDDCETLWEAEGGPVKEEDDSLDDGDLAYINAILNSFSKPKFNHENSNGPDLQLFTPEGALTRALAPIRTPPKFNQNFNQNLPSCGPEEDNFSYFSNFEEEGPTDLADYFSDKEEDDSLDEEDPSSESDTWSQTDFNKFEDFSNKEQTPRELDTAIFGLETINEADLEDQSETNSLNGISSLSEETKLAFSAWQTFIPPKHAFQNFAAQSWPSDFSPQASSSQEPTLIQISTITTTTKQTPTPIRPTSPQLEMALSQLKDWHSFRPAMRSFTPTWTKASARINKNLQQNKELVQRISRSPRAIKTIQALEAAITMFSQNQPVPEYQTSEYATGNRCWKRAPSVHPVAITDLLEYEVKKKHNQNKIVGDKVAQILKQNTDLSDKIAEEYQTPSEKLKKDPIMALVMRTVSTYMLLKHNRNGKTNPKTDDFSSRGEPFFKKKE
jgi:hypothetical protein